MKINNNNFITEANTIHSNKYDYSKVKFINSQTKVCIICPEHGEFWQLPYNHLHGKGCVKCTKNFMNTELFIEKARRIHNNKYDYSKVEYLNKITDVIITCPTHGEYKQKPTYHLSGNGCPKCKFSVLEREIEQLLKENNIHYISQYRDRNILGVQSLDFYLPDKNIAIECQGIQHFKPVDFGNKGEEYAKKIYEKTIYLDKEKLDKCIKNNITILYYSDKKYGDNIITDKNVLMEKIL